MRSLAAQAPGLSRGLTLAIAALAARADADKAQALLAGEVDPSDACLEIHAGAGGAESQDRAEMLQRMSQNGTLTTIRLNLVRDLQLPDIS